MIYLFYDENNRVNLKYYVEPTENMKTQRHLVVNTLMEPDERPGKIPVLYADESHYWYEYEDKPKTQEEIFEERMTATEQAMADLMLMIGGKE